jgi:hypothetical protein
MTFLLTTCGRHIVAENIQKLQTILNIINEVGKEYDLSINVSKTKLIIVSRQSYDNAILYINDQPIERTNKFKYLGSTFNDKWDNDGEVKIRVAKATFVRFDKYLLRQSQITVIRCYI